MVELYHRIMLLKLRTTCKFDSPLIIIVTISANGTAPHNSNCETVVDKIE